METGINFRSKPTGPSLQSFSRVSLSFDNDYSPDAEEWIRIGIQINNGGKNVILHYHTRNNGTTRKTFHKNVKELMSSFPNSEGTITVGSVDQQYPFEGEITNLFIYTRLLTVDEIEASFAERPIFEDALVGWWEFDRQLGKARIPL